MEPVVPAVMALDSVQYQMIVDLLHWVIISVGMIIGAVSANTFWTVINLD